MSYVYAPGCALVLYKPDLANKIHDALCTALGPLPLHMTCCHHEDGLPDFPLPDYGGLMVSVHDACPTRTRPELHAAVRALLKRMNMTVMEAERSGANQACCGDSFYPTLPVEEVNQRMRERADQMPADDVCVYCVSCVKAMALGGKRSRYLADLMFGEETIPGDCDTTRWHEEVDRFIESH